MSDEIYESPMPGQAIRKVDNWHSGYNEYTRELIEGNIQNGHIITSEVRKHNRDNPEYVGEYSRGAWYPGTHKPVLDIDFGAKLVPSSTEGHFHLYLDKEMSWEDYKELLEVLAKVGIIEDGYMKASIARKYSAARLPWVPKEFESPDGEMPF